MVPRPLIDAHQTTQEQVVTNATRALVAAWRGMPLGDAEATTISLLQAVPAIVETFGDVSTTVAADFYDEARATQRHNSSFRATPAPPPPSEQIDAMVRWAVTPVWSEDPRLGAALARLSGGTSRLIRQAERDTLTSNSIRDPDASGWQRITRTDACNFCRMLADRGAVYTEDTVRFASHDNCRCSVVAAYDPGPELSVPQYEASKRRQTEADRQRVRDYLKQHYS